MPKLKKIIIKKNSMSWDDVSYNILKDKVLTTLPKRAFLNFLKSGKKVKKITVEFHD